MIDDIEKDVVLRLKTEREDELKTPYQLFVNWVSNEAFISGKQDAVDWAKREDYREIGKYVNPYSKEWPHLGPEWAQEKLHEVLKREIGEGRQFSEDYAKGWLMGIDEFWKQVEKQFSDPALKV